MNERATVLATTTRVAADRCSVDKKFSFSILPAGLAVGLGLENTLPAKHHSLQPASPQKPGPPPRPSSASRVYSIPGRSCCQERRGFGKVTTKTQRAQRHKESRHQRSFNAGFLCVFVPFVSLCLQTQFSMQEWARVLAGIRCDDVTVADQLIFV